MNYNEEVTVKIQIGRAKIMLKDLEQMTVGRMIALDKNVEEPVDLLVNDIVIAKCEIVVINGHYGVKILETIDKAILEKVLNL